jgi:2-phosphoglycolate phosphatase
MIASEGRALRGVVFDLDGTLIDSRGDIAASTHYALAAHGFPLIPRSLLLTYVGDGARRLLARSAELAPEDPRLDALVTTFIDYYTAHPLDHTVLCRGAERALGACRDLLVALCTNKPRVTTERVLAGLDLDRYFRVVIAGGDLPQSKPDPLPILHIASELGLEPAELAVVGDGAQDVLAGRAAGARTVGLTDSIQPSERIRAANPDVLLDSLEQLPALLSAWKNGTLAAQPTSA